MILDTVELWTCENMWMYNTFSLSTFLRGKLFSDFTAGGTLTEKLFKLLARMICYARSIRATQECIITVYYGTVQM